MLEWPDLRHGIGTESGRTVITAAATAMTAFATVLAAIWGKNSTGDSTRRGHLKEMSERVKFWTDWEALHSRVGQISEQDRQHIRSELERVSCDVRIANSGEPMRFSSRREYDLYRQSMSGFRRLAHIYPLPRIRWSGSKLGSSAFRKCVLMQMLSLLRSVTFLMQFFVVEMVIALAILTAFGSRDLLQTNKFHLFVREMLSLCKVFFYFAVITWILNLVGDTLEREYLSRYTFADVDLDAFDNRTELEKP